jgi:hypothetical protein
MSIPSKKRGSPTYKHAPSKTRQHKPSTANRRAVKQLLPKHCSCNRFLCLAAGTAPTYIDSTHVNPEQLQAGKETMKPDVCG